MSSDAARINAADRRAAELRLLLTVARMLRVLAINRAAGVEPLDCWWRDCVADLDAALEPFAGAGDRG